MTSVFPGLPTIIFRSYYLRFNGRVKKKNIARYNFHADGINQSFCRVYFYCDQIIQSTVRHNFFVLWRLYFLKSKKPIQLL